MDAITELCREYTDLNAEEINEIKNCAKYLSNMSSMFNADAFIDCQISDGSGDSIVVAESKPIDAPSSYKKKVVGLIATKEKEPAVYRTFHLGVPTKFMKAVTQEDTHVVQTVDPIMYKDRIIGVFIIEQRFERLESHSFTSRMGDGRRSQTSGEGSGDTPRANSGVGKVGNAKEYEDRYGKVFLKKSKNPFVDTIEEGIIFVDGDDEVVYMNKAAIRLYHKLGFVGELTGTKYRDLALTKEAWEGEFKDATVEEVKIGDFFINVKTVPVFTEDIKMVIALSDVTDLKLKEEALVLKSVAFKEMHHRVKNNMQTIAGLLRLQRNKTASPEVRKALSDTVSRILAISSTHEILLETDLEKVKLNEIVSNLRDNNKLYYDSEGFDLSIDLHGGDFDIKFDKAVSVALILNELIQNSIKHGFEGRKQGKINIITRLSGNGHVKITYSDNGRGFDEKLVNGSTMGMSIIKVMIQDKLKGHWNLSSSLEGTVVRFEFENC